MKKFNFFLLSSFVVIILLIAYLNFPGSSNYRCINEFKILSRNEWNAKKPADSLDKYIYKEPLGTVLKNIVIHHSSFSGDFGVKNIQKYQMRHGFNDIAYHYVIGKDGKIYEGRDITLLGAHAGETLEANNLADSIKKHILKRNITEAYRLDPDYGSIGICLDGNFEEEKPTECQIHNLKSLIIYLIQKYNIDKTNIMLHNEVRQRLILQNKLHPVKEETICPGKYCIECIKNLLLTI